MNQEWPPQFAFVVCQRGAERALKAEVAAGSVNARPAFSRPGFVTFKLKKPCERPERFQLPSTFARAYGFCLGKLVGDSAGDLAQQVWQLPALEQLQAIYQLGDIHVWQRDASTRNARDFELGSSQLAREIETIVRRNSASEPLRDLPAEPRSPTRRNCWVLDVVIVEPNQWWIGCHRTNHRTACWPGGVPLLQLPEDAVSRAFLKMSEALAWSALPIARDELCLELGCAPGGAAQALLESGLRVIGVDPAEVDPAVAQHPKFRHVRRRSLEIPKRELHGVRWLAADMNVAPTYTLDAVESAVTDKTASIRGLILTLKLTDWKLADELPKYIERVRSWGYRDVRTRQLAFNRQEVCLVALRSRGQRRIQRRTRRQFRADTAHTSGPSKAHLPANM